MDQPVIALFWDIDGTLLTTGKAGIFALMDATEAVCGKAVDLQELNTAGLTDVEIARDIIKHAGLEPTSEKIKRLLTLYGEGLPKSLFKREGYAMPNLIPILEKLKENPAYFSILLTGNIREGARAKLNHYKLSEYFTIEKGAFSDDSNTREDIAIDAFRRFKEAHPNAQPQHAFVIGDTKHDIRCAKAIDAKVIGVGTGPHTGAEMEEMGAWWGVDELPDVDTFFNKIQEAAAKARWTI